MQKILVHVDPDGEYGVTVATSTRLSSLGARNFEYQHLSDLIAVSNDHGILGQYLDFPAMRTASSGLAIDARCNLAGELSYYANIGTITDEQFWAAANLFGYDTYMFPNHPFTTNNTTKEK